MLVLVVLSAMLVAGLATWLLVRWDCLHERHCPSGFPSDVEYLGCGDWLVRDRCARCGRRFDLYRRDDA